MTEYRYNLRIDGQTVAENMTLEVTTILLKAICETWYAQPELEITIERQG